MTSCPGTGWTAVLSWLFGTVTIELQQSVHIRGRTACDTWLCIEEQFLGNGEARALHLDAEFCMFVQGDLVDDYCRKMKGMADALGDLGEVIPDCTLCSLLNILHRLNRRYDV
jgi:hypothetical protein